MKIRKRRSDRSGRAPLSSPGRPSVAGRDERRRFWAAIAVGLESEDAALEAGVPPVVGTRWFRKAGGILPAMFGQSAKPLSGRYLLFAEREEIALLRARGYPMREVARRLGRKQRRRSHGSCGAMPPLEAAVWSIARRQRNGMPSEPLAGQSRGSLRSTRHCEPMLLCPAQPCPGKAVDMDGGRIGRGQTPGARSRSPAGSRSTSRTMTPCASAMKPSIKPFEDEARCGAS